METNECPNCHQHMETYYSPWCPRCDKPERKTVQTLNLIKALRHIEVAYDKPGYKDRMWRLLIDWGVISGNDIWSWWSPFPDETDPQSEASQDVMLFADVFEVDPDTGILLEISW